MAKKNTSRGVRKTSKRSARRRNWLRSIGVALTAAGLITVVVVVSFRCQLTASGSGSLTFTMDAGAQSGVTATTEVNGSDAGIRNPTPLVRKVPPKQALNRDSIDDGLWPPSDPTQGDTMF